MAPWFRSERPCPPKIVGLLVSHRDEQLPPSRRPPRPRAALRGRSGVRHSPLLSPTDSPRFRFASSTSTPAPAVQDPKVKANALIDALPGNSLVSKTGWITLTTAVSAAAISNELFVLNEEVVILGSFVVFIGYISSLVREPYREWADGQIKVRPASSPGPCTPLTVPRAESDGDPQHVPRGAHRRCAVPHRDCR